MFQIEIGFINMYIYKYVRIHIYTYTHLVDPLHKVTHIYGNGVLLDTLHTLESPFSDKHFSL